MNIKLGIIVSFFSLIPFSTDLFATAYTIPPPNQSIVGRIQYSSGEDNVVGLAKRYDLGYNALENANPHINMNRGAVHAAQIQLPTKHLLPNQAREGIVINLPEMRMYYYPLGSNSVYTYPIGIGKLGKTIPIKNTYITRKTVNPYWTPPDDIREFNLDQGVVLPKVMPPGPDNPLGPYAIYMGIPTYLIHSTIFPESVGKRASFGCIRMYESDIEEFFPNIQSGVPVAIINDPAKVGWQNNTVYLEAHTPLEEHENGSLPEIVHIISNASQNQPVLIDWQGVAFVAQERDGIPHDIGFRIP